MERKVWRRPQTLVQKFEPNEYCTGCGTGTTYLFECNAGKRWNSYNVYFEDGTPYASSNGREEWYARFTGYHPCYETHKAASDSGFRDGYMYHQDKWGNNEGERIDVVIWTEYGTDVHCTRELDRNEWEIARS